MVSAETGLESRAPRDQSERRHRVEGLRCSFSSLLSSNYPPIFSLSLAPASSAPRALHLPSPIFPASQPTSVHHTARRRCGRKQPLERLRERVPLGVQIPLGAGGVMEMNYDSTTTQKNWDVSFNHAYHRRLWGLCEMIILI